MLSIPLLIAGAGQASASHYDVSANQSRIYQQLISFGNFANQQPQTEQVQQPAAQPVQEKQQVTQAKPAAQPVQEEQQVTQAKSVEAPAKGLTAEEKQMLNLVNEERQKAGLAPLKANLELTKVARLKAQDMIAKNYFAHQSPTYGSPFEMMKQFGISYKYAAENLAGTQSVIKAHTGLMNSDGHRKNIMNGNYTEVGIGIIDGGSYGKMFVQMFKG